MVADVNVRLYKLLDVDPATATSERIRANFDKMSLREQFHQAYFVLSDGNRKRIYDLGGERTLDYLLSKSWGPMVPKLGVTWCLRLYGLSVVTAAIALLLWFVLLALKIDSVNTFSWTAAFIPIFVLVGGNVAIQSIAFVCSVTTTFPREDSGGVLFDRLPPWCNLLASGCYAAFAIVVALALEGDVTIAQGEWIRLFALLTVADVLGILSSCTWRRPEKVRRALAPKFKSRPPTLIVYGFSCIAMVCIVLSILRWSLIGAKIDGDYSETWYLVFAPIPARLVVAVLEALLNGVYLRCLGVRTRGEVFFMTLGALFMNSLVCVAVYVLAATLEGARLVSMGNILVPMYVLAGYLVLAAIYTAVVLPLDNRQLEAKDRNIRLNHPQLNDGLPTRAAASSTRAQRSQNVNGRRSMSNMMLGGVPVLMPDDDKPPLSLDMVDVLSVTDEEEYEEEELEEVEVDVEPEHYMDDVGNRHDHSPFEGPGSDPRYAHRYGFASDAAAATQRFDGSMDSSLVRTQGGAGGGDGHNPYGGERSPQRLLFATTETPSVMYQPSRF